MTRPIELTSDSVQIKLPSRSKTAARRTARSMVDEARNLHRKIEDVTRDAKSLADRVNQAWTLFS